MILNANRATKEDYIAYLYLSLGVCDDQSNKNDMTCEIALPEMSVTRY